MTQETAPTEIQIIDLASENRIQLRLANGSHPPESHVLPFPSPAEPIGPEELLWYFQERFTDAGPGSADRAESIQSRLSNLGRELFHRVFEADPQCRDILASAISQGLSDFTLAVVSGRTEFLSMPWELLNDSDLGYLARQLHSVVRRISDAPLPESPAAPGDAQFNVLLVSPFLPQVEPDPGVSSGSLAAETLKVLESVNVQVELEVLRPATFAALSARLAERPGWYHLVHLDGFTVSDTGGALLFEGDDGAADPIHGDRVAGALAAGQVPVVLLNSGPLKSAGSLQSWGSACRILVDSGVPFVVSAPLPLTGSARQSFIREFYQAIIQGLDIPAAVAHARGALMDDPHRPGPWGNLVQWDWPLPLVYQSAAYTPSAIALQSAIPTPEAGGSEEGNRDLPRGGAYGLVGRRSELCQLELLVQRSPVALLAGPTGIGKTELALELGNWINKTGNAEWPGGVFYTTFEVGAGLERVVHEIGTSVAGLAFADLSPARQREWVVDYLEDQPSLLIWDSLERVAGLPPVDGSGLLETQEQADLAGFLEQVTAGGSSGALLVSRAAEHAWLGGNQATMVLSGLTLGDRIELGGLILNRAAQATQDAPQVEESYLGTGYLELMDLVEGHPLAMQIVLPLLREIPAQVAAAGVQASTAVLKDEDREAARPDYLTAAMDYSFSRMSRRGRVHLPFLSLFQRRVLLDILTHITQEGAYRTVLGEELGWGACRSLLRSARDAGFIEAITPSVFQINPSFPWFYGRHLHRQVRTAGISQLEQEFVRVYADTADYFMESLYENQDAGATAVLAEEGNLTQALALALESKQWDSAQILVQPLAQVYRMQKRYPEIRRLRRQLLQVAAPNDGSAGDAQAEGSIELWLYLMGTDASEATDVGDLARSEEINQQLLEYLESQPQGDADPRTAAVYHQFGAIALQRWQVGLAEEWFQKSLAIIENGEDRDSAADDYHSLGQVCLHQRRYTEAKQWFGKSLDIHQSSQDQEEMVKDYRALGLAAQYKFEYEEAESWYQRARAIVEENRDEATALLVYHSLGTVYHARYIYEEAERWYKQALTLSDQLGNQAQMALEFHYLGLMEQSRGMFYDDAEDWFELALQKRQELGDRTGAGDEYRQLGVLHHEQKKLDQAEQCYRQALDIFQETEDLQRVSRTLGQLAMVEEDRSNFAEALSWAHRTYQLAIGHDLPVMTQVKAHLNRLREKFGEAEFDEWWRGATGGDPPDDLDVDAGGIL